MARISVDQTLPRPQGYASDGTDAIGFIQFYGNSPALDLINDEQVAAFGPAAIGTSPGGVYSKEANAKKNDDAAIEDVDDIYVDDGGADETQADVDPTPGPLPDNNVNVLISGAADIRHVVKTLARWKGKSEGRRIKLFLHESNHETLARHLLFLQIINNSALPVRERMETFLSMYGNTLIRERDEVYLSDISAEFVELITDNSEHPLVDIVDLSHLRYKDRDVLQDIFKGWNKDVPFDIEALREQRCRGYYRDRFDHRKNLFDFDYQTYIKDSAGIINWFHYKEFCFTGVAYETRLATYCRPNRTLASYTEATDRSKGSLCQVRGFWGDIINSPYHGFGTSTNSLDKARLFKISGSQYRHTETDISCFNLTALLSEMDTGQVMHLPPETPEEHEFPYTSPLESVDELKAECAVEEVEEEAQLAQEASQSSDKPDRSRSRRSRQKKRADWPALSPGFEGVDITLLAGDICEILKKPKYKGSFHRAFVGSMGVLPIFEEMGLTSSQADPFRDIAEGKKIRNPPRIEAPQLLGVKQDSSALACAMAEGAEVVFETMKYQAHFEGAHRLGYRHRVAQCGHLAGWRLLDERHALPRLEHDAKNDQMRKLEREASDFMRFVTGPQPTG